MHEEHAGNAGPGAALACKLTSSLSHIDTVKAKRSRTSRYSVGLPLFSAQGSEHAGVCCQFGGKPRESWAEVEPESWSSPLLLPSTAVLMKLI